MGCGDEKLSKYLTQTFTAHCNAMICQQVTLSGDAEWPKVADAVIEACPWMVLVHSVTRGWQDIRFLLGCMGYIAIHTTPEGRRVLPLCIEGRNLIDSKTYPRKGVRQARATQQASCVPANVWRAPGRLRSVRARGRPASTNRCRVRWTVERPTRKMAALSSSVAPAAAWSSRWAQATLRADGFPCFIRQPSSSGSTAVQSMIYLLAIGSSS